MPAAALPDPSVTLSALDWHGPGPAGAVVGAVLGLVVADAAGLAVTVTVVVAAGVPLEQPPMSAAPIVTTPMSRQEDREYEPIDNPSARLQK